MSTELAFRYRAAHRSGAIESGSLVAASREDAESSLASRGLFPIELRPAASSGYARVKLPAAEAALGLRMLATLLRSGMTVMRALEALDELASPRWRSALPDIRDRIRGGSPLVTALRASRLTLPPAILGIIEAGEAGSGVASAVDRAAELAEREAQARAALREALAYPMLLLAVGCASVLVLVTVVLPRFAEMLGDLGAALPASTRALLGIAALSERLALPGLLAVLAAAGAWRLWIVTASGERAWNGLLLSLPVAGGIRHAAATARVARALSALLASGVPIAPALQHAARAAGNSAIGERLTNARTRMVAGERLSAALSATASMTPVALRLVRAGEQSGALGDMLAHAAALEVDRTDRAIRSALRFIEPAVIIVFGGMVAFIAAALLQAVYSVRPA